MNNPVSLNSSTALPETKAQLRLQIEQYVKQLSETKQAFHKWMKFLEVVGFGLILAAFILAMYVSIAWESVNPLIIPIAWFAFVASACPLLMLIGLHAVILKVFPPVTWTGKMQKFIAGSEAVRPGWGFVVLGLALLAFWGFFAYATWTQNWALLTPLITFLGVVMGVGMAISILYSMFQKIIKSR